MLTTSIPDAGSVFTTGERDADKTGQSVSIEHVPPCRFHTLVSLSGCAGAFCDGYTIGVMGAVLPYAAATLQAGAWGSGLLGSGTLFGLLLGTLIAGYAADRWGRKPLLQIGIMAAGLMSLLQLLPLSLPYLCVIRFALGVALAADYVAGSTYQTEFLPRETRGKQVSLLLLTWSLGYAVAFQVAFVLGPLSDMGWRLSLALGAIPALMAYLIRSHLPESIVWLVSQSRHVEAHDIAKMFFKSHTIDIMSSGASDHTRQEGQGTNRQEIGKRLVMSFIFMVTHLVPYFSIGTFSIDLFRTIGIDAPYLNGVIYTLFLVLGAMIGRRFINAIPRNLFIFITMMSCFVALLPISIDHLVSPFIKVVLFSFFSLMLSASCCIDYVYLPELFPPQLRSSCIGLIHCTSRTCIALSTLVIPPLFQSYGVNRLLQFNAAILFIGAVFCLIVAPDTRTSGSS